MPKDILEIRFIGRGGQGAKTAGQLLAIAAFHENKYIQAFPEFGAERVGAPVNSFVRISKKPILIHSNIENSDITIVLNPTLLKNEAILETIKNSKTILVNSKFTSAQIKTKYKLTTNVFTINSTDLALKNFNNILLSNTITLGALTKVAKLTTLDNIKKALKEIFKGKSQEVIDKNIKALEIGYK